MNPAPLIVPLVFGFIGYIIGITLLPHVIEDNARIHNAGVCVVSSAATPLVQPQIVAITQPRTDHNGKTWCDRGDLVRTIPNGS